MTATKTKAVVTIRQVKSGIGYDRTQVATLKALGLGKIGRLRQHPDNPQIRGMIEKVSHLVALEDASEG